MLAHVAHSYRKFTEPETDTQLGADLITDINGHTTQFPTITFGTPMTAFATIQSDYAALVTTANGGATAAIAARNQFRENTWLPAVDGIADLVDTAANGDPSIILLSSFHATKTTRDASVVPVQMTLAVSSPNAGNMNFDSKTVVQSHVFQLIGRIAADATITQDGIKTIITTNKATTIVLVNTNNKKGSLSGLISGLLMAWKIIARNPAGTGPASQDATVIIQ